MFAYLKFLQTDVTFNLKKVKSVRFKIQIRFNFYLQKLNSLWCTNNCKCILSRKFKLPFNVASIVKFVVQLYYQRLAIKFYQEEP